MSTTEAERLRDEGHAQTEAHADARVIAAIDAKIARLNSDGLPWSANLLRSILPVTAGPLIGARVRAAAMRRPREMEHTGRYVMSTLPSTRGARVAVWRGVS